MKELFFCSLLILSGKALFGQEEASIHGRVLDSANGEGIPYVNLLLMGTEQGISSGPEGAFSFEGIAPGTHRIRISTVGYKEKVRRIHVEAGERKKVMIRTSQTAYEEDEVVVTGNMKRESRSNSPVKVQTLEGGELRAGAAGNVIEGIGMMNGVREQVACGVCGTNGIRINGMATPYTLVMIDGMPFMGSLGAVYGLDGIPSSLVERIEVTKGPSSTLYGPRAVAGVVNVITRDPQQMPRVSFKADHNTHGQSNAQLTFHPDIASDSLSSFLALDHSRSDRRIDENGDGFTDFPLKDRISLFNKWSWIDGLGGSGDIGLRYYHEDRHGGTLDWRPGDEGSSEAYGEAIETRRFEMLGSYRFPFEERIRIAFSYSDHFQDSYYGTEHFKGEQRNAFTYLTWRHEWGDHELLTGANLRYERYRDNTPASADAERAVPGFFVQDEWTLDSGVVISGGLRADLHGAHGTIMTPRLHFKWDLNERTTFRLNSGSGFREVDVFTEDHAALTGSREVVIEEELLPERSWNLSTNLSRDHHHLGGVGTMDLDLFYTRFSNKIVPDLDSDPDKIIYRNLKGYGVSKGVALSFSHRFHFPLEFKLGGTYQRVHQYRRKEQASLKRVPELYAPRFTGTFRVKGKIPVLALSIRWEGTVTGPQHLPEYPEPFTRPVWSPWYSLHQVNVRRRMGDGWGIYIGVKNLFDQTQPTPLIDPGDPFSSNFDTEYIYGPLQGRRIYFGIDLKIKREE